MSKLISYFSLSAIINQLSKMWKTIVVGILVSLGGVCFTLLVAKLTNYPVSKLMGDPADIEHYPLYIGMLSNWGVILWIATATICLFGAMILKYQKTSDGTVSFFTVSGIFSLILGFDDLYMLHDRLLPKLFHVSEALFYIIYIVSLLAYLAYFAFRFLKYDYMLLMAALLFFVLSRQDVILHQFEIPSEIDDMLKYSGIVFWLAFFYRAAMYEVNGLLGTYKSGHS